MYMGALANAKLPITIPEKQASVSLRSVNIGYHSLYAYSLQVLAAKPILQSTLVPVDPQIGES